jgi:hypothetical protein
VTRLAAARRAGAHLIAATLGGGMTTSAATLAAQRPRATVPAYEIAYVFDATDPATHEAPVRLRVRGPLDDSAAIQQIDSAHANVNPGKVVPYVVGHKPDPVTDVLQTLNDVTRSDLAQFFRRYVTGMEELPYGGTLGKIGLRLVSEASSDAVRIEADPDAPEEVRQLGDAWLEGR